jgi:hypothetical protein
MNSLLELTLVDHDGCQTGPVLLNVDDIESVKPAYGGTYRTEIGSLIRTRSGDNHTVSASVKTLAGVLRKAIENQ